MVRSSLTVGPMRRNITRYRRGVRLWALVLLVACGRDAKQGPPKQAASRDDARVAVVADAATRTVNVDSYPDLGAALKAIVPADARVVGFGELHNRTDGAQVKSTLAR